MSQENADELKRLANRLEAIIASVKSGGFLANKENLEILAQLEQLINEYEDILEKENKMS